MAAQHRRLRHQASHRSSSSRGSTTARNPSDRATPTRTCDTGREQGGPCPRRREASEEKINLVAEAKEQLPLPRAPLQAGHSQRLVRRSWMACGLVVVLWSFQNRGTSGRTSGRGSGARSVRWLLPHPSGCQWRANFLSSARIIWRQFSDCSVHSPNAIMRRGLPTDINFGSPCSRNLRSSGALRSRSRETPLGLSPLGYYIAFLIELEKGGSAEKCH